MAVDPFSTDSGFPTDYSGTVVDCWFAVPSEEKRGTNLNMVWKMQLDDPGQHPQADGGVWEESFGCGDGWETPDGGSTAVFPGNSEKRFHANSGYGKVITAAVTEWNLGDLLRSRAEAPTVASIWKGLRFHIDGVPYKFKNKDTGEQVTGSKNYPVQYLGEGTGGGYVSSDAAGYSASDLGVTDDLFTSLRALAMLSDTYKSFLDAAIQVDGVKQSDRLIMALAEESFYDYLRGVEEM